MEGFLIGTFFGLVLGAVLALEILHREKKRDAKVKQWFEVFAEQPLDKPNVSGHTKPHESD